MDEELLATLLGEPPSERERNAALVAALRRQKAAGGLGLLTGDRVLSNFGAAQLQGAQAGEALQERRADRAGDARARVLQLALSERDKAATRAHQKAVDEATAKERAIDNDRAERGLAATAENNRLMRVLAFGKDARAEAKAAKGKDLPPTTVEGLADLPVAQEALDRLGDSFTSLEMGSTQARASNMLPTAVGRALGTDVSKFQSEALLAMQGVGKIMEGGKLAAGDEVKYRAMLPQAGDDEALAKQKLSNAKAFLQSLVDRRLSALKSAGYNVPDGMTASSPSEPLMKPGKRVIYLQNGEEVEVD